MTRSTPQLCEGILIYQSEGIAHKLVMGTPQWQSWLTTASAFVVVDPHCTFTARKERAGHRRGGCYWRAYYKNHGRLYRVYIGSSQELTQAHLHQVAVRLAETSISTQEQPADQFHSASRSQPVCSAQRQKQQHAPSQRHHPILLKSKLSIPTSHAETITRWHLYRRLQPAREHKLTLVSAPAGFGKTTLLSSWANSLLGEEKENIPAFAWFSLDKGDNDPTSFWTYWIAALDSLRPGIGDEALSLLLSAQPVSIQTVLTMLLNALNTLGADCMFVLDDYHLIETQAIHQGLQALLELRTADLRFTGKEVTAFLNMRLQCALPSEVSDALAQRIEGWAAGLQLAVLSLEGQEDAAGALAALAGDQRYLLDYLIEEVFTRQSEQIQHFLLQTCILDRLCGSLCHALTDMPNAQEMLVVLEQKNLFLTPLDSRRSWYRYHHLFADALRAFARQRIPERIPALHLRASYWYEQQGTGREAIEHAIAAGATERTASLIEQLADASIWAYAEIPTLQRWLDALSEQLIRARPQLCILSAWALQFSLAYRAVSRDTAQATFKRAEAYLQHALRLLALDEARPGNLTLRGEAAAILSLHLMSRNELERCGEPARLALELLPREQQFLRCLAARMLFNLYDLTGDDSGIEPATRELTLISRTTDDKNSRLNALLSIACYHATQGELKQAADTHREALRYAEETMRTTATASPHSIGLSQILLEWNELSEAEDCLMQGIGHLKKRGDPYILLESYRVLAALRQAQGDYEGLRAALEEQRQAIYAFQQYNLNLNTQTLEAQRAWLSILEGDLPAARRWALDYTPSAEQHLSARCAELIILARVHLAVQQSAAALQVVSGLLAETEKIHFVHCSIQLYALQALALAAQGRRAEAVTSLAQAVAAAEPGGYLRLFLNEGVAMATLLLHLFEALQIGAIPPVSNASPRYISTLLTAFGVSLPPLPASCKEATPPLAASLTLSTRETELLRLIALGYSDRDIARQLFLAESTVKTYAKRLYAKLGVKNRTQAATRARVSQLL